MQPGTSHVASSAASPPCARTDVRRVETSDTQDASANFKALHARRFPSATCGCESCSVGNRASGKRNWTRATSSTRAVNPLTLQSIAVETCQGPSMGTPAVRGAAPVALRVDRPATILLAQLIG